MLLTGDNVYLNYFYVSTTLRIKKPDSQRYIDENWRRDLKGISANS